MRHTPIVYDVWILHCQRMGFVDKHMSSFLGTDAFNAFRYEEKLALLVRLYCQQAPVQCHHFRPSDFYFRIRFVRIQVSC